MQSINPLNGEIIRNYTNHTIEEVTNKVEAAHLAFQQWRITSFENRSKLLVQLANVLRKRKDELAVLMANEMGKPVAQGIAEVEKCASCCEYYAENGPDFLNDQLIKTEAQKSYVSFQPIGVVLAIMPWNFPFWQVFRFLCPAFMAGNTAVLKHASNVPGCALVIEELINEAGFPNDIFHTLLIDSKEVDKVIEHPFISAVTLTGSTEAGKKVAAKAGSLIKKTVLELGGSDAYLVLKDADVKKAAETCVTSRLINSGQSCIAAKRFIVVKEIAEEFIGHFKSIMEHKKIGNPLENGIDIGPLARIDLRDQLHQQVQKAIANGAKCILGGEIPKMDGAFYTPTILTEITAENPAFYEEFFGPVAQIYVVNDEDEAIKIANSTSFGLGGAVFSQDSKRAEHIANNELEAGSCFVNAFVKSDPRLPFGGIKESGYGRELGLFGIHEFVNIKTVYIS
ncbi:NAD-dependent succinate-semialdehyde dehydrogenase [Solitalea sp. MAHUQ-68]|uniref:NAD-dependent succinate-semialdehyde dehydrogenase n=1 Tax=Solitalea agri TaxID=2953739 RepID=A0A9X2JDP9_9SPHI|nr:NAD-dependent succinate-semialdehyde dehydrogenase [Solitalea agri]MCO4291596.1 NAD-dependent succinate-semialdehyde dehydrogenase [Solitalea agri]